MTSEVSVNLLFFAKSRELVGECEALFTTASQQTLGQLLEALLTHYPQLQVIRDNFVLAHNQEYIDNREEVLTIQTGDEIAIIPPISGGVEAITEEVTSQSCGAISIFVGTTRDNFNGKTVVQLEYEAYESMAKNELKKICQNVRTKWAEVEHIAVHHRLGVVPMKEASVMIAVSSPHRLASLEAVHFTIDTLKATVPIWKKEVYAEEGAEWKENKECAWAKQ